MLVRQLCGGAVVNASEIARSAQKEHARKAEALAQDTIQGAFLALTDCPTLAEFVKYTEYSPAVCASACVILEAKGYRAWTRGGSGFARFFNQGSMRICVAGWNDTPKLTAPDHGPYRALTS